MALKQYKQTPVHIVENHNEVLPHIYKAIGSKYLPIYNNTLVHFDSHPDLLIPSNLNADDVFENKYELFNKLSIENWILPAVYAGHFSRIIWIKQKWCNQIENGIFQFSIGKNKSNQIKITATNAYFLSEILYESIDQLENIKQVELIVVTFTDNINENIEQIEKYIDLKDSTYVLDVDLDYISTRNPFQDLYKLANMYERLKVIYKCQIPERKNEKDIVDFVENRTNQLLNLKDFFDNVGKVDMESFKDRFNGDVYEQLIDLVNEMNKYYTIIEWDLVHDAGCTCDELDKCLPHHVTDDSLLLTLIESTFNAWFDQCKHYLPKLITISRSSEDDYCPSEQVDIIQNYVLDNLRKHIDKIQVYEHYQEDSS